MWRQGDVLIQRVEKIPRNAVERNDRILIEGMATGHCHELAAKDDAVLFDAQGEVFLHVRGRHARLIHAEHDTITLEGGCYRVWRQREYAGHGDFRAVLD